MENETIVNPLVEETVLTPAEAEEAEEEEAKEEEAE